MSLVQKFLVHHQLLHEFDTLDYSERRRCTRHPKYALREHSMDIEYDDVMLLMVTDVVNDVVVEIKIHPKLKGKIHDENYQHLMQHESNVLDVVRKKDQKLLSGSW